ncbi:ClpP family protease [Lactonifactor longoviformis]|uniref:ClpP family protease n=2 Tax=Lactonifactor longoviformis TaxID=341220 RepID=UPI0031192851
MERKELNFSISHRRRPDISKCSYKEFFSGKRMTLPNAEIMLHQPAMYGNGIRGPESDIKIMSDYMQKSRQRLNKILSENTGRTVEEIKRDTDRDHFMNAE